MKKIIILFIGILLLTGCTNEKVYKKGMYYMDTYIEVKLYDIDKTTANKLLDEVDKIYSEYHKLTDRYTEYDGIVNVYYLNNILKNNTSIKLDPKLSEIIKYGIDAYSKTDGYVNIAMGNVIDVWKSYREEGKSIPKTYELMNKNIDIDNINLKDNTYTKTNNVSIDLGAYAKGYVTQEVGDYFESRGITKYLINAGGNVKVGEKYKVSKYNVGLETPFDTSNIYKTLKVENTSIVTSGSYQRYYEVDGVNYNHIINPKTLYPDNYTKSVTVVTSDSAYADVMSTYLFLIPIEDGIELVNNTDDIEVIWYNDQIYYSKGFNYE